MTVSVLLQRFDFELPDAARVRPVPRISLKPEPALQVFDLPRYRLGPAGLGVS